MRWFLYYNSGSCNYGDHYSGLETFDTLKDARERVAFLQKENFNNLFYTLIEGRVIESGE
jgi:hypothetical protein